jgi:GWxTD domain-containing protein
MLRRSLTVSVHGLLFAGLLAAPPPAPAQDDGEESVEARMLRTWSGDDVTVVDGLASVPLALLGASTDGAYKFELEVYDSDGNKLATDGWDRTPDSRIAQIDRQDAALLETFRFAVKPGSYEVVVRAYPTDLPDMVMETRLPLEGYGTQPDLSDLFLAYRVEPIAENSGGSRYPVMHSGFGIGVTVETVVLSDEPELYYYLELYGQADSESSAKISAEIIGAESGRVFYRTPQREVAVAGLTPFTGPLSLAGLPPGEYELVMNVEGAGISRSRRSPFRMVDRSTIETVELADEEGYFFTLSDEELESTFGGVATMLSEGQRRGFEALPPDAKRRFLTQFFAQHDPDPATPENAFLDEYMERIDQIRIRYGSIVGQKDVPPWKLPRGRIWLKYGEPTDQIINTFPTQTGRTTLSGLDEPPYEIWYYGKSTGFVYLFAAEDRFGTWRLMYTTDPWEKTLANWRERVGEQALQDLRQNYGIQVNAGSNTQ